MVGTMICRQNAELGSNTYGRRQAELNAQFLADVVAQAVSILHDENARDITKDNEVIQGTYNGKPFKVYFDGPTMFASGTTMTAVIQYWDNRRNCFGGSTPTFPLRSMTPLDLASEALYAHHGNGGFVASKGTIKP